ncbi:hypothetical protein DQ04_14581000 [Trypanosoma grayi]|uniref:hypothetical protein n=1 Tax=Trypanosoma grayi TaxID=71804 RepID=UPI0004F46954|nr:hypothetical protein DQ04_14581000 [Trypanosoma grayi]KEG06332.1 hypothetical protein DQ04_14581000 [Trypanosoma grayi]
MWNPRPAYGPHGGNTNAGFLPPINAYSQQNSSAYNYGNRSFGPNGSFMMGSYSNSNGYYPGQRGSQLYGHEPSQPRPAVGGRMPPVQNSGNYPFVRDGMYAQNHLQRNNSFLGKPMAGDGNFSYSQGQGNSSWIQQPGQIPRNDSFMGGQQNGGGSFMYSQMQRNSSWMQPPGQFPRNDSFMGSSNLIGRNSGFGGSGLQNADSFGGAGFSRYGSMNGIHSFDSFYAANQHQGRDFSAPPPPGQQERQGLALLLRKQSVLHKGRDTIGGENQSIGRRNGGLTFKGVIDDER